MPKFLTVAVFRSSALLKKNNAKKILFSLVVLEGAGILGLLYLIWNHSPKYRTSSAFRDPDQHQRFCRPGMHRSGVGSDQIPCIYDGH